MKWTGSADIDLTFFAYVAFQNFAYEVRLISVVPILLNIHVEFSTFIFPSHRMVGTYGYAAYDKVSAGRRTSSMYVVMYMTSWKIADITWNNHEISIKLNIPSPYTAIAIEFLNMLAYDQYMGWCRNWYINRGQVIYRYLRRAHAKRHFYEAVNVRKSRIYKILINKFVPSCRLRPSLKCMNVGTISR